MISFSTSDHDIVTIRKRNCVKSATPDPLLKPGQILCLDIVKNPAKCASLTQDTTFTYYPLVMDKFSRYPFLAGLANVKTRTIIEALQYIRSQLLHTKICSEIVPLARLQSDYSPVFTPEEFLSYALQNSCKLTFASRKYSEMNSTLERTWQSLCHLKNTFIVQARVDE